MFGFKLASRFFYVCQQWSRIVPVETRPRRRFRALHLRDEEAAAGGIYNEEKEPTVIIRLRGSVVPFNSKHRSLSCQTGRLPPRAVSKPSGLIPFLQCCCGVIQPFRHFV